MEAQRGWGIFARLWTVMMIIALVPVGWIGYLAYREAQVELTKNVDEKLAKRASHLVDYTELWLDGIVESLEQVGTQPVIVAGDPTPAPTRKGHAVSAEAFEPGRPITGDPRKAVLESLIGSRDYLRAAYYMRQDGWQTVRSDTSQLVRVADRPYFLDNMRGQTGIQVVISRVTQQPALIVSVPVRAEGRFVGGVAVAAELSTISNHIAKARFGETGYAFITDKQGKIVAHPDATVTAQQKDMTDHPAVAALQAGTRMPITFKKGGVEFVAVADTTKHGWTVVTQEEKAEAYAALTQARRKAVELLIIAFAIVTLLSSVVSRWLSSPIRTLTRVAEQISRGEVDADIAETRRGDEIGALARAIARLQTSVRLALEQLEKGRGTQPSQVTIEPRTQSDRPPPRASMMVPRLASKTRDSDVA